MFNEHTDNGKGLCFRMADNRKLADGTMEVLLKPTFLFIVTSTSVSTRFRSVARFDDYCKAGQTGSHGFVSASRRVFPK